MKDPAVKPLLTKLTKYYWSERPPEAYVPIDGTVGLAAVAHNDYGAFNITWALASKLKTSRDHIIAIGSFRRVSKLLEAEVEGATLSSWCCLLSPEELNKFCEKHRTQIEITTYDVLTGACLSAVQKLSRV